MDYELFCHRVQCVPNTRVLAQGTEECMQNMPFRNVDAAVEMEGTTRIPPLADNGALAHGGVVSTKAIDKSLNDFDWDAGANEYSHWDLPRYELL